MLIQKAIDFKYMTQPLRLPLNKISDIKDNMLVLMIKDSIQALGILRNEKIQAEAKYMRYYKPIVYNDKLFTSTVRHRMKPAEKAEATQFAKSLGLTYYGIPTQVQGKNVIVDTSPVNNAYFEKCKGRSYMLISEQYIAHFSNYINKFCSMPHPHRFIIVNVSDWGISQDNKAKTISSSSRLLNPISIMYFLMRKKPEALEPLKDYRMIVQDGHNGWFTFSLGDVDKDTWKKFNLAFQKVRSDDISIPEADDDDKDIIISDTDTANKAVISKDTNIDDINTPVKGEIESKPEEDEEEVDLTAMTNTNDNEEDIASEVGVNVDEEEAEKLEQASKMIDDSFETIERSSASLKRDKELREAQKKLKIDTLTLADVGNPEKRDYHIEETDISSKVFTPSKNVKKIRFDNYNKSYVETMMEKDIMNVFLSLNDKSLPVYVRKVTKEDTSTAMDLKYTYHVELEGADRVRHSFTIDIPRVFDNNYFVLGGNRKQFVNQMFPKPVVKTSPDELYICTNYMKIFMERYGDVVSPKIVIFKKVINNNPKLFKVRRGNAVNLNTGRKSSIEFDTLAKDYLFIEIRGTGVGLYFDHSFFDKKIEEKEINASIKEDYVYVLYDGRKGTKKELRAIPVNIDKDADGVSMEDDIANWDNPVNGNMTSIVDIFIYYYYQITGKNFWDLANPSDKGGKRFMYTRCTIMKKNIPTILLLSYYEGLTTVMNKAAIPYRFTDKRPKLTHDEGMVQFSNGYLVYKREPTKNALLMNGLTVCDTKNYTYEEFDNKPVYLDIFDALYKSRILAPALDSFYDNMIDPISKEVLEDMHYPTDFVTLMIHASNLLSDNAHTNELSQENYRIRGMEQVAAYLYKIVASAYSKYKQTAMNKTPVKISVPKNELIKTITTSNNVEDYSTINPITEKEKLRGISFKGPTGINVERAYTPERRCMDDTMKGLIGITTSPDAMVGVNRELTIEPKVINSRGYVDVKKTDDEINDQGMFTYAEQLTPMMVTHDDAIRASMGTKQSKHVIPVKDMSPVLISTGTEKMLPYTASKDFAIQAKDDGKVVEVNKETNMMVVTYKDGTSEAINLNPVVVKNSAGGFFLSNQLTSDLKVGNRFKKMDILASDKTFFSKHYDGVKFNLGTLCKVACMSSFATFEDSKLITQSLSERMATEMIMKKNVILGQYATVSYIAHKGQEIHVGDNLIVYEQSTNEEAVNKLLRNIGDDLKEEIKEMGKTTLKSKYTGVIEDVRIYSTFELSELSPSLKKIVGDYWKTIKKKKDLVRKYKITDPTYSGSTYYEMDGPTKPDEKDKVKGYKVENGGVIFEFYVKYFDRVGVGDKLCDCMALKGVTGAVVPKGQEPYTIGHPDEEISTIFPASSVLARLVPSVIEYMFATKMLVTLKKRLKDIYFEGKQ